ncbi:MAG TPA: hypothetical protein VGP09_17790, partial [Caballeronia sp.]|nr:hypothetical protein [Caballeronia sp.]
HTNDFMDVIPEVRALFVADKASVRDGGQGQQRESDALDDHEAAGHFQGFLEFLTLGDYKGFHLFFANRNWGPGDGNDTCRRPVQGNRNDAPPRAVANSDKENI